MNNEKKRLRFFGRQVSREEALKDLGDPSTWKADDERYQEAFRAPYAQGSAKDSVGRKAKPAPVAAGRKRKATSVGNQFLPASGLPPGLLTRSPVAQAVLAGGPPARAKRAASARKPKPKTGAKKPPR